MSIDQTRLACRLSKCIICPADATEVVRSVVMGQFANKHVAIGPISFGVYHTYRKVGQPVNHLAVMVGEKLLRGLTRSRWTLF